MYNAMQGTGVYVRNLIDDEMFITCYSRCPQSGHQLDASLALFGTVLGQWTGTEPVHDYCLETILRLSNLHLKNLSEVKNTR